MNLQGNMDLVAEPTTSNNEQPLPEVQQRLLDIDWSFTERERVSAIESIHPYPAKFIGEIPRTLLSILPIPKNTYVFDPFNGSGTTLVEAQRRGVPSIGVDLNPIACLIARVKTAETPTDLLAASQKIANLARKNRSPQRLDIPNVDHWFEPDIQEAVGALLQEINKYKNENSYDALRMALSSILVRVSNQESDTRYAAIKKPVSKLSVFEQFENAILKLEKALTGRDWSPYPAKVIEANTLLLKKNELPGKVGLVITSPPYPNAYEYWLYHKYRMWWLGYDPLAVKEQEIGARAHFFKRNAHTADNFVDQMRKCFSLLTKVLVMGGYASFVIGRSKIRGELIDNGDIIAAAGASYGFEVVSRIERTISSSRKSFNLSHANIKTETILVLQKTTKV